MTKRLIVNADDYGLTPGVSSGIREAHLKGIVTTATAMMNMPSAREDLQIAARECPMLGLGVHLVLTAGEPLRHAAGTSFRRSDGRFYSVGEISKSHTFFDQIDAADLGDEWRAQIEKFMECGAPLDHLDSHHHISFYHAKPYEVMHALAEEYKVGMRTIVPLASRSEVFGNVAELISASFSSFSHRFPVSTVGPEGFISAFMHDKVSLATLFDIVSELPDGRFELMCHPGRVDAHLESVSSYSALRQRELDILMHAEVLEAINRHHILLSTYRGLGATPLNSGAQGAGSFGTAA